MKAIIFDYGDTLVDIANNRLYPGAVELLSNLKNKGIKLGLVSRAADPPQRWKDFKRFNLDKYIEVFDVVPRDTSKEFDHIIKKLGLKNGADCIIVGDRIKSEIVEGNKIGAKTIWIRQGRFTEELPESKEEEPVHTIKSLDELLNFI